MVSANNDVEFETILFYVVENWNHIKYNNIVLKSFDINTNSLCRKLKHSYPQVNNYVIQSYVLALSLFSINLFCSTSDVKI